MNYTITIHARGRFRSRYMSQDECHEIGDQVADDWLQGLIRLAVEDFNYEDIVDDSRPMRVVELSPRYPGGEPLYACIRDRGVVVSLLEKWQRDNNRRSRWRRADGGLFVFGVSLRERLAR